MQPVFCSIDIGRGFWYNGSRILKETDGTNTITYYYGGSGAIGFNYNGTDYLKKLWLTLSKRRIYLDYLDKFLGDVMKKFLIIEDKLRFLITDNNMIYNCKRENGKTLYVFHNQYGNFIYWEWPQFSEDGFEVQTLDKKIPVNILEEYPEVYNEYSKSHKGIKWLFKDIQVDYWDMIASIIKLEIQSTGKLFGLNL